MNFNQLKTGEVLSEVQYYKVAKKVNDEVQLVNDFGENIVVDKGYVEKCLNSADQFTSERKVNKTEAAEFLISHPNIAMKVSYQKQVKEPDVVKEILDGISNASIKDIEKAVRKGVKKSIDGEERTITGRHSGHLDDFGRLSFIDMEIDKDATKSYDNRIRLVDPRGINFIIVGGEKITVK